MTARYRITGSWDDPRIQDVPVGTEHEAQPGAAAVK